MRLRLATLVAGAALLGIAAGVHGAPKRIARMLLHVRHNGRQVEVRDMGNAATTETTWVGITTDGSLGSNWSNGVPDDTTINAILNGVSVLSIATGFTSRRARQTLVASTPFVENDTVTLDSKMYTYKDAPSADGEVDVGTNLEASLDNLFAAINLVTPIDGAYGASMTIHPTVTVLSNTTNSFVVAAKDGGTAGNSIDSLEGGGNTGNGAWLAGTLENGAVDGATMSNIYIDPPYSGSIHTSGTKPLLRCGLLTIEGSGQINLAIVGVSRIIINSPNYAVAADLIMTSSLVSLEIISGRCKLHAPAGTALPDAIFVSDIRGLSENLRLTGDSSLTGAQLIIGPGIVSIDGPDWTAIDNMAGFLTIEDGAVDVLRSTGRVVLKSTDTMTVAYIMGGELDTTQGSGAKTVTNVWVGPSGVFSARRDIDNFTEHLIGRK